MIDGLPADMVALALPLDIEKIVAAGLIRPDWAKVYPNSSVGGCRLNAMHVCCLGRRRAGTATSMS